MTPPNVGIARVEQKVDAIDGKMTAILERLASIEATSKAEASERATIHSYTQSALEGLAQRISGLVDAGVYDAETKALADRVKRLEQRATAQVYSLIFPIVVIVVGAILTAIILGRG